MGKVKGGPPVVIIDHAGKVTIYKPTDDRKPIEGLPLPKPLAPMGPARQKWPKRKAK